ncbi:MAG: DUF2156 domain-containing protein [Oscillospiraceae bacterium]|nr:DUF2156 domain-containing protein [Oscillospiraceae bacterium]
MEQIEAIRTASGSTLYVYTFASLFSWKEYEQYEICFGDGAFIIKNGTGGSTAYLFPCGSEKGKKELIDGLLQFEAPVFYSVTDDDKLFLEIEYPGRFTFEDCRDEYPYLYDKDAQIAMAGKEYKRLRHQVNLGRAIAGEWSTEQICEANIERALKLTRRWGDDRDPDDLADTAAAETALRNFSRLSMWGMLFQADGNDIAYVAGVFITPEIFDICFCKVLDRRCDCFIKWALYQALPRGVKTVDSEDDMGVSGLRTHKLLRRPKELTRVWKGSLAL